MRHDGLERIAADDENGVTRYVYDGRGSVAQTVNVPVAGEAISSNLPDVGVQVQTFSYTAYGEQMGGVKASGFTYNAEAYDAATSMLNLRARKDEPAVGRFSGKNMMRGYANIHSSLSVHLYREAQEEISRFNKTAPDYHLQVDAVYRNACARYMGEEKASAAKQDEKERQIYELEQRLSDADRAAGIRVVELDGQLYYDYTDATDRRIKNAISDFQSHMVDDRSNESVHDVLSHVGDCLWNKSITMHRGI